MSLYLFAEKMLLGLGAFFVAKPPRHFKQVAIEDEKMKKPLRGLKSPRCKHLILASDRILHGVVVTHLIAWGAGSTFGFFYDVGPPKRHESPGWGHQTDFVQRLCNACNGVH